jgi:hypothetical protein
VSHGGRAAPVDEVHDVRYDGKARILGRLALQGAGRGGRKSAAAAVRQGGWGLGGGARRPYSRARAPVAPRSLIGPAVSHPPFRLPSALPSPPAHKNPNPPSCQSRGTPGCRPATQAGCRGAGLAGARAGRKEGGIAARRGDWPGGKAAWMPRAAREKGFLRQSASSTLEMGAPRSPPAALKKPPRRMTAPGPKRPARPPAWKNPCSSSCRSVHSMPTSTKSVMDSPASAMASLGAVGVLGLGVWGFEKSACG